MDEGVRIELRFARGQADASELQAVVDETLAAARTGGDSDVSMALSDAGLDPDELSSVKVEVEEQGQGAGELATGILIAVVGGVSRDAVMALAKVLRQRIRRQLGADALGDERES